MNTRKLHVVAMFVLAAVSGACVAPEQEPVASSSFASPTALPCPSPLQITAVKIAMDSSDNIVGTNCSAPTSNPAGDDWAIVIRNVALDQVPVLLTGPAGSGLFWRMGGRGSDDGDGVCDGVGRWPLVAQPSRAGSLQDWTVRVESWPHQGMLPLTLTFLNSAGNTSACNFNAP